MMPHICEIVTEGRKGSSCQEGITFFYECPLKYVNATLFVNGPLRKCVTKNTVSQDILLIYRGLTRHETIHTNTLGRKIYM